MTQLYQNELAQLYDTAVPDWPGEIDFYRTLAHRDVTGHQSILEVACGTGRVAIQLAKAGFRVTGLDLSEDMLSIARSKSTSLRNPRWVCADMRSFDLDEASALTLVPAYSFQLLLTEQDQLSCLEHISRHALPGARVVLHLEQHDADWVASLPTTGFTDFDASGEAMHPHTGKMIRVSYAWSFDQAMRRIAVIIRYETLDSSGRITHSIDRNPMQIHVTSSHDLEALLARANLEIEESISDFAGSPVSDTSADVIWIARKRP